MRRAFGNLIFERCTTEEVKLSGAGSLLKTRTDGRRRGLKTEWSLEKLLKRVPKVQCSDAESLRQKDRVKKDTEEKQPRNKKAVRRNEKIPEARFFAVFFNQSHVLQEKSRRRWYFFSQNGADVSQLLYSSLILYGRKKTFSTIIFIPLIKLVFDF